MGNECPHGSLRRSCEICERDEEITRLRIREEKIVSFFEEMAEAIRGNRQFKPNPRTERFINHKLEELREILGQ